MKPTPPQVVMTHDELGLMVQIKAQQLIQMVCHRMKGGDIDPALAETVADRLHVLLARWIATEQAASQQGEATLQ